MRLDGKVGLITGAAHGVTGELMGFGGAAAWMFVREGAKVVLADIDEEAGQKTAAQIGESGGEAIFVHLDVTSERAWVDTVKATVDTYGRLDILVNNAGTGSPGVVEETTEQAWDDQMAVHAKGTFFGTKHAIPEMRKVGGGSIVNISSIYGIVGTPGGTEVSPGSTAYHAAKGASRLFTKSAAIQYAKENIRINSVHPGYCLTPMTKSGFDNLPRREWLIGRTPMGRYGTADEVAAGILFLASDESSFMTGSELVIDGGMTAQ